jgi:hypothetical protein
MNDPHHRPTLKLAITDDGKAFEFEGEATIVELLPAIRAVFGTPTEPVDQQMAVTALVARIRLASDRLKARIEASTPEVDC